MIRILRIVERHSKSVMSSNLPRHLVETELGHTLSNEEMNVEELVLSRSKKGLREVGVYQLVRSLNQRADILLVNQGLGIRLATLRAVGFELPMIVVISYDPLPQTSSKSGQWLTRIQNQVKRFLYRRLDLLIVVSDGQASWLQDKLSGGSRVAAIPMAIDLEAFRSECQSTGDYILMADGALRDYATLAEAIHCMLIRPSRLVVVHRAPLANEKQKQLKLIGQFGVKVDRQYRVSAEELRSLYEDCLAVVIPLAESCQPAGLTALLEAMAMGCAIVCTRDPWLEEYVTHRSTALLVPPRDSRSLGWALTQVLSDSELRTNLKLTALKRGRTFDFDRSRNALRRALRTTHEGRVQKRG